MHQLITRSYLGIPHTSLLTQLIIIYIKETIMFTNALAVYKSKLTLLKGQATVSFLTSQNAYRDPTLTPLSL